MKIVARTAILISKYLRAEYVFSDLNADVLDIGLNRFLEESMQTYGGMFWGFKGNRRATPRRKSDEEMCDHPLSYHLRVPRPCGLVLSREPLQGDRSTD